MESWPIVGLGAEERPEFGYRRLWFANGRDVGLQSQWRRANPDQRSERADLSQSEVAFCSSYSLKNSNLPSKPFSSWLPAGWLGIVSPSFVCAAALAKR